MAPFGKRYTYHVIVLYCVLISIIYNMLTVYNARYIRFTKPETRPSAVAAEAGTAILGCYQN